MEAETPSSPEPEGPEAPFPSKHVRRVMMAHEQELRVQRLLSGLRHATGTNVDFSVVTRALWMLAIEHGPEIVDLARRTEIPKRPPKRRDVSTEDYEDVWREILRFAVLRSEGTDEGAAEVDRGGDERAPGGPAPPDRARAD